MTPGSGSRVRSMPRKVDAPIVEGLSHLGLSDYEVRVYLAILRHPRSRVPEIARLSKVPQPKVYTTLKKLIARGLCEKLLGPVNAYVAQPPQEAFRPLLEDLHARQQKTREALARLKEEFATAGGPLCRRDGRVRLYQGRHAAARTYKILLNAAEREVSVIARLPLVVNDDAEIVREKVESGARVRQLYELPDGPTPQIRRMLAIHQESGAQLRWRKGVPMRMVIFDRRITGLPMVDPLPSEGDGFTMLEIRNQSFSEGFCEIFDELWEGSEVLS